jgi:predicted lipoprotein with Yx(FWY)xxD motif
MRNFSFAALTGILLLATAAPSFAKDAMPAGIKETDGMLVDAKGMTLYTYDNDKEPGKSSCVAKCLENWPAAIAPAGTKPTKDFSVITRDDGARQLAYQGKPLYTFVLDKKPGDIRGDGRNKVWRMVMP